ESSDTCHVILLPVHPSRSPIRCCVLVALVWNAQKSTDRGVVGPKSKLAACGTSTKSSLPSRLNACPTSPTAKPAPFCSVPLLPSSMSLAFPSPGHQLIMFGGGGVHVVAVQTPSWHAPPSHVVPLATGV